MYVLLPAMFGPVINKIFAPLAASHWSRASCKTTASSRQAFRTKAASGVVRDELALRLDDVQHGVPPIDNAQHRLLDDLRPAIVPLPGQLGQGHQHVDLGQRRGRRLHPPPVAGHHVAKVQEQRVLQFLGLLVGRKDFFLVLFQFRRDVALGVLNGLLADVVGGDFFAVGVGDLDIVAEHLVEPHPQARDARPLGLLGLITGDPLLAAVGQLAEGIQLGAESVADKPALATYQRTLVGQRPFERRTQLGAKIDGRFQIRQRPSGCTPAPHNELVLDRRQRAQRAAQETQITRVGPARRDPGQQPLHVVHAPQILVQVVAQRLVADQFLDGV